MDLYEYQAKELLDEQDIPTPRAIFAQNSHEVAEAADALGYPCVIKAQVKIGHRGQAGGVKLARTRDEAVLTAEQILPMTIHGHKVHGVLVAEAKNILHEYYVSISVDRSSRDFDVLATANGGTEVEEIAKEHPEAVKRLHITSLEDFDIEAARRMANDIGFYHADEEQAAQILLKMWKCFLFKVLLRNFRNDPCDPDKLRAGIQLLAQGETQKKLRKLKMIPPRFRSSRFRERAGQKTVVTAFPVPVPGQRKRGPIEHRKPQNFVNLNMIHLIETIRNSIQSQKAPVVFRHNLFFSPFGEHDHQFRNLLPFRAGGKIGLEIPPEPPDPEGHLIP